MFYNLPGPENSFFGTFPLCCTYFLVIFETILLRADMGSSVFTRDNRSKPTGGRSDHSKKYVMLMLRVIGCFVWKNIEPMDFSVLFGFGTYKPGIECSRHSAGLGSSMFPFPDLEHSTDLYWLIGP